MARASGGCTTLFTWMTSTQSVEAVSHFASGNGEDAVSLQWNCQNRSPQYPHGISWICATLVLCVWQIIILWEKYFLFSDDCKFDDCSADVPQLLLWQTILLHLLQRVQPLQSLFEEDILCGNWGSMVCQELLRHFCTPVTESVLCTYPSRCSPEQPQHRRLQSTTEKEWNVLTCSASRMCILQKKWPGKPGNTGAFLG